jgi:hypothetical protein
MSDKHNCLANATPVIDRQIDGEPILSATLGDQVEVYVSCRKCGQDLTLSYGYVDSETR